MTPKATSNSLENTSKRPQKTDLGPGGAQGLIFDRFLMILGSIFECIFDNIYAWYAVFLALFSFVFSIGFGWYCCGIDVVLMLESYRIDVEFPVVSLGDCCDVAVAWLWDFCDCCVDPYDVIINMVLLWDCFGIAVILLWHSYDCCWIAIGGAGVLLRCRCRIPMGLMWNLLWLCWGLLWYCYGSYCCGLAVWVLWLLEGIAVILLWCCCGNAFVLLRYFYGIDVRFCGIDVEFPMLMLGDCGDGCGIAVAFLWVLGITAILLSLWYCCRMALVLLWSCCGIPAFAAGLLHGVLRLLRYGCGVPVGLIWKFPVPLLGIAVISLWYCCVIPVGVAGVFLGYCRGITVVLLWHCCGNALVLLRYCNGIPVGCFENTWIAVVTRLLWKSIEEVVRQFH